MKRRMTHGMAHDATMLRLTPNQIEEIRQYVATHHPSPAQLAGVFRLTTQEAGYFLKTETGAGTHYQPHHNVQLGASKAGWDDLDRIADAQREEALDVVRQREMEGRQIAVIGPEGPSTSSRN